MSVASIDKGTRGSAGRKCPHTASKPLRIHKVFSAAFSLSASISAPAELLRIGQPWIFEGFLFFWTQAGCRPPRRKGQKAPERTGCPTCGPLLIDALSAEDRGECLAHALEKSRGCCPRPFRRWTGRSRRSRGSSPPFRAGPACARQSLIRRGSGSCGRDRQAAASARR